MKNKLEYTQDYSYLILEYERRKQLLSKKVITPDEYEERIREIVKELKI